MSATFEVLGLMPIDYRAEEANLVSRLPWRRRRPSKITEKMNEGLIVDVCNGAGAYIAHAVGRAHNERYEIAGDKLYAILKPLDVPNDLVEDVQEVFALAKRAGKHLVSYR